MGYSSSSFWSFGIDFGIKGGGRRRPSASCSGGQRSLQDVPIGLYQGYKTKSTRAEKEVRDSEGEKEWNCTFPPRRRCEKPAPLEAGKRTHTTIRWLRFQNNLTCLLPLAQRNWADKLVKVYEKQIVTYEIDPRMRYPTFDRFATGDMLYDWDILDVNHKRLQHTPDPKRRKAATTFSVGVEQFQKGKGKSNGGAADSAGGGAAPAGPGGRTNLKPKEAAADANAVKAGGKLPPPEKVITPGEEGYRPLYIHLQHKGLVVGPSAAQRIAELTNSGYLAAQK
uniref:Uncharacterized protein n=1 Tax=Chromera velia CCMP2878 TaxID=1169474 RepID=A0A0G4FMS8_9ALVE|eukprot:Cvel_17848.t1-p1 / transcript=Cvel_17848.t1 / gene=Cvel_17848 / organism=Chromera_velia_CCMP2878 / gene_product=hypothetical protein / transcript_product=hypothetical protein / location=Cvel_scaffold1447:20456-23356(-) / protein_length=280 / sequence_SO=supercontig / SO=protein_coding / is_pseudo=false